MLKLTLNKVEQLNFMITSEARSSEGSEGSEGGLLQRLRSQEDGDGDGRRPTPPADFSHGPAGRRTPGAAAAAADCS